MEQGNISVELVLVSLYAKFLVRINNHKVYSTVYNTSSRLDIALVSRLSDKKRSYVCYVCILQLSIFASNPLRQLKEFVSSRVTWLFPTHARWASLLPLWTEKSQRALVKATPISNCAAQQMLDREPWGYVERWAGLGFFLLKSTWYMWCKTRAIYRLI